MQVFRITRKAFSSALTGAGAARDGGRWNSPGIKIIYTAQSRALALAEMAVHISAGMLINDYVMLTIDIPNNIPPLETPLSGLPVDWNKLPYTASSQHIGDAFIINKTYCVLKVPSVVVPGDFNYLINPNHPDFGKITIVETLAFPFDNRLFNK